jgi:hypothetical protein
MLNKDLELILNKIEELENLDIEIRVDYYPEDENVLSIHLFSKEEFEKGQLGYRFDEEGNSLIEDGENEWKESWYVIGYDDFLGDPIFVDINNKNYPVMTAMHDGDWQPALISSSINEFLECIL